ncbi:MAG: methyltransferase domain-containing protein [Planctomycetaceae bacterium]
MNSTVDALPTDTESAVYQRYAAASQAVEPALCCPVEYSRDYLSVIPQEIIEKDYGCGDPSPFVHPGETVLDLGSGGGKLCYILAQIVGSQGRVIGVDCNTEMLSLARKYLAAVADQLGYGNVEFRYGLIQDLQLNLDLLRTELARHPIHTPEEWLTARSTEERLRRESPLVAPDSVDCVVSNCVLNLVRQQDRQQLFAEIFRVLKPGGRAAISDIVASADVPEVLQRDGELWSGCISGAYREDRFLDAFHAAGFYGLQIARRQSEAWRTVGGIEFRSMTVLAYKPPETTAADHVAHAIYKGPFRQVHDDEGRSFVRAQPVEVTSETLVRLQRSPYAELFEITGADATSGALPLLDSCCGGETNCC